MTACIESHYIGKQDSIRSAMRNMEMPAQSVRHAVVQSQSCIAECDTRQARSVMHFLTRLHVIRVFVNLEQVGFDQFHGFFCRRVREIIGIRRYKRFNRMRQHIDARIRRCSRRYRTDQLCVQNCRIRQHIF